MPRSLLCKSGIRNNVENTNYYEIDWIYSAETREVMAKYRRMYIYARTLVVGEIALSNQSILGEL